MDSIRKNKRELRREQKNIAQERRRKNVESIYPEEMINDNISVISMDTDIYETKNQIITTEKRDTISNKFDAGLLYAENLELKN